MSEHVAYRISEKWYDFIRWYCNGGGYIDRWMGDCADDPNRERKSPVQLNSHSVYFRLNGGEWFHGQEFKSGFSAAVSELSAAFPAEMIWESYKRTDLTTMSHT